MPTPEAEQSGCRKRKRLEPTPDAEGEADQQDGGSAKRLKTSSQCAICFESIGDRLELPCSCQVDYCFSCWDHALAASARSSNTARCPTCRTAVRVDVVINESTPCCKLRFSRDSSQPESYEDMVNRLTEQARPLQVRLLAGHTDACTSPQCVCGNELRRVSLRERIVRSGYQGIICDLCDKPIRRGSVWTCQNGLGTVLHPASYDVCEQCFRDTAPIVGELPDLAAGNEDANESDVASIIASEASWELLEQLAWEDSEEEEGGESEDVDVVSTTLTVAGNVGDCEVQVESRTGFAMDDQVRIGNETGHVIVGGSRTGLALRSPLQNAHEIGTVVDKEMALSLEVAVSGPPTPT